ncbi:hypothetical protein K461DRAFT_320512 [Myriangium duriaei CBS 260.36]|uniref:Uncharacterized protein n=1 Tax=Myriangium duriaei CBS 260.36 TaxID=1168546 RepID=A0A9P4MIK3_9PEZI|nr:hypothetical protein K461DRAFT_320512 [Myriangium duriaei CBS 260.36]
MVRSGIVSCVLLAASSYATIVSIRLSDGKPGDMTGGWIWIPDNQAATVLKNAGTWMDASGGMQTPVSKGVIIGASGTSPHQTLESISKTFAKNGIKVEKTSSNPKDLPPNFATTDEQFAINGVKGLTLQKNPRKSSKQGKRWAA